MKYGVAAALLLFLPAVALAAPEPQVLELSAKAQVEDATIPLGVVVSTQNQDVTLSSTQKDGSTPVTFTLYLTPKPKPPVPPAGGQTAAAVESSHGIQQGIGSVSPAAEGYVAPIFSTLDSARSSAAGALDTQLASTKAKLGPTAPGEVLGAEISKPGRSTMDTVWYVLNTLYFYLLTIVRFIIGSAAVFYPVFAILVLWLLWRGFRLVRRPAY